MASFDGSGRCAATADDLEVWPRLRLLKRAFFFGFSVASAAAQSSALSSFVRSSSNASYSGDLGTFSSDLPEESELASDEEELQLTSCVAPRPFFFATAEEEDFFATAEEVFIAAPLELAGLDVLVVCNSFGLSAAFAFTATGGPMEAKTKMLLTKQLDTINVDQCGGRLKTE